MCRTMEAPINNMETSPGQFLTPGSDQGVVSSAILGGGDAARQAFGAEYNSSGIKTNLVIPLTTVGSGNNAGMKSVVGGSGFQATQNPISSSGNVQSSANMGFRVGIGWWIGFDQGIPKLFIGDENGDSMSWDGDSLDITGSINATTGMIGGFQIGTDYIRDVANSFGLSSAITGGDDVRFWAGDTFANRATAPFRVTESGAATASNLTITGGSLTIGSNATIDSSGNATFISVSTLNKKAYTNFEGSGRFINTTTAGLTIAPIYGNQGVTIDPTATASRYCRILWYIANVFTNSPTFTTTLLANSLGAGDARGFIGIGQPTVDENGIVYSGNSQIGFRVDKTSGVTTVSSETNDGGSGTSQGASMTTLVDGDVLELFFKATPTAVKFYYRKNGGTITLSNTQTTHIPVAAGETSLTFAVTNTGSANAYSLILQCAAYEH